MDSNIIHSKGWLTAIPLENFSSLHELSLPGLLNLNFSSPKTNFYVQFSFNLHTPLTIHPNAFLTFHARKSDTPPAVAKPSYSFINLNRWALDISSYKTVDDFLSNIARWHRCNFLKSKKVFEEYGCSMSFITGDWSEYAEIAYTLYENIARRHGDKLYDLLFFKTISQRPDYKICCAWFENKIIGILVLQEEYPTLHSIFCGFDYEHSSKCYAYSWMHYALIEHAIKMQKFQAVDVGLSADEAKKAIGFKPTPFNMDIYSKSKLTRGFLRAISPFISTTLTPKATISCSWNRRAKG